MSTAATVIHAYLADHAAPPILVQTALQALRSSPAFGGFVLAAFLNGLVSSLCIVAVLVFFRLLLRKTWLASSGVIVLAVPVFAHGTAPSDIALAVCLAAVNVAVLLRVGVVAHMAMLVMMAWLTWLPLTLDPNAWYFGRSLVVLSLIGGLAAYGFFTALGGRPAFGMLEPAKRLSS